MTPNEGEVEECCRKPACKGCHDYYYHGGSWHGPDHRIGSDPCFPSSRKRKASK